LLPQPRPSVCHSGITPPLRWMADRNLG
jgi:hypothetical protein